MQDSSRRFDLDWVRIAAFALLILYHVGMYYVSWDWHVKSPFASTTLEPLMMLTSPWRLSLLFFVSGVATAFLMQRRPQGFAAGRSRRLLVPLVFGMLVIVTPQAYYEVVEKLGHGKGYLSFWGDYLAADSSYCPGGKCLRLPTWNHLWFVAYLWVYSMVLWAVVKLAPRVVGRVSDALARACSGIGVLVWPIAIVALSRMTLVSRFPSTHAMAGDWFNHALFGSVFVLGFLLAKQEPVWESLRSHRKLSLSLAVASYLFIAWYFNFQSQTTEVSEAFRMFQRVIYAINQWSAIAAVLGFAREWSPGDSPARRYLTEAVFPFYIVHQTAIVVLAHQLKPVGLTPAVEGPMLVAAAFAICFASFEIVRRVGWLRPLFGLGPRDAQARQPRASTGHTALTTPASSPPRTTT